MNPTLSSGGDQLCSADDRCQAAERRVYHRSANDSRGRVCSGNHYQASTIGTCKLPSGQYQVPGRANANHRRIDPSGSSFRRRT
jgi:hypothetical protein